MLSCYFGLNPCFPPCRFSNRSDLSLSWSTSIFRMLDYLGSSILKINLCYCSREENGEKSIIAIALSPI